MDLTSELDQVYGLLQFLIKLGCYYIPTLIGATVSCCVKNNSKNAQNRRRRNQHKITEFFKNIGKILAYSITPAFLVTAICSLLSSNIGDSTIIYGIAFICGAIGEDITIAFTSLKSINKITTRVSENVESLKGVAAMTNAMMPDGEELPVSNATQNTSASSITQTQNIETELESDINTQVLDNEIEEEIIEDNTTQNTSASSITQTQSTETEVLDNETEEEIIEDNEE